MFYFLIQHWFDMLSVSTPFSALLAEQQVVIPFALNDQRGVLLSESQLQVMFPDGAQVSESRTVGVMIVSVPADAAPARRTRRAGPMAPNPPQAQTSQTDTVMARLEPFLSGLRQRCPDRAVTVAEPLFERCAPRTSGAGLRVILASPADYARVNISNYHHDALGPQLIQPSFKGVSVFLDPYNNRDNVVVLAEAFYTPEGGCDLFVLLDPQFLREVLTKSTGSRVSAAFDLINTAFMRMETARQRLDPSNRDQRFTMQRAPLVQFARLGLTQARDLLAQQLRMETTKQHELIQRMAGYRAQTAVKQAMKATIDQQMAQQRQVFTQAIDALLASPLAREIAVEPGVSNAFSVVTQPLVAVHPKTNTQIEVGSYKIILSLTDSLVRVFQVPQTGVMHPLVAAQDLSSIYASVMERLQEQNYVAALRIVVRFLQLLPDEHPLVEAWVAERAA